MAILKKSSDRKIVLSKFNSCCAYCGNTLTLSTLQIDHIKPIRRYLSQAERLSYKGEVGENILSNYYPSCKSCNSSKSTFSIEEWRRELELKRSRLLRDSSTFRSLVRFDLVTINENKVLFHYEKFNTNG